MSVISAGADSFQCPTCGARQAPASECRRCKSDLHLVIAVHHQKLVAERACLDQLRCGRYQRAFEWARRRMQLSPDEAARRILTVILLLQENYQAALAVVQDSNESPE